MNYDIERLESRRCRRQKKVYERINMDRYFFRERSTMSLLLTQTNNRRREEFLRHFSQLQQFFQTNWSVNGCPTLLNDMLYYPSKRCLLHRAHCKYTYSVLYAIDYV